MGVEALETAGATRAADPDGQLGTERPLLRLGALEACLQLVVPLGHLRPARDAAARLEPRELRNEVRAGNPELGRKRPARVVMGPLLGHGRESERTAHRHPRERPRRTAELLRDDGGVVHLARLAERVDRAVTAPSAGTGANRAAVQPTRTRGCGRAAVAPVDDLSQNCSSSVAEL